MNELRPSKVNYKVVIENEEMRLLSNCKYMFEDAIYDEINENWIFAVQAKNVEYLYLTKEFEIIKAITDPAGLMPHFVKSDDGSIWTTLESISTAKDGEIVLPLEGRDRISKEIVKRSIGMDYFTFDHKTYGYFEDIFDDKKESQIATYEFDKKSMFKNRKMKKLENICNGYPFCNKEYMYFAVCEYGEIIAPIHFYQVAKDLASRKVCTSMVECGYSRILVDVTEDCFTLLITMDDVVKLVDIDHMGKIVGSREVYQLKSDMINYSVYVANADHCMGVIRTESMNYAFLYKSKVLKLVEVEDKSIRAIDGVHFITGPLSGGKYWTIRSFD